MNSTVISVDNLEFSYSNNKILKGITFELNRKEILGILGPNGGGKSTLLKLIVGLLKPETGTVFTANHKISYLPQKDEGNNNMPFTIYEFLETSLLPNSIPEKDEILKALKIVDLENKSNYLLANLSGGELQRTLLAKAWLSKSDLIILDEPTKGLDGNGQDQLLELIHLIKNEQNAAIILVDHNIQQVLKHCDRLLCLNKTSHWHNSKELINKKILENIYHCEFEHLIIHEQVEDIHEHGHHLCDHHHDHNHDEDKK